jgi:hypothetical protein
MHIALVGDSVFDNAKYTGSKPDVAGHLRGLVPEARVTLYAVDGTTTAEVGKQIDRLRPDITHALLSLGGNDALENADLLDAPVRSTAQAWDLVAARVDAFEAAYRWALESLLEKVAPGKPRVTVCTIYGGSFPEPQATRIRTALAVWNDAIVRAALAFDVGILDLRAVCTEPSDFTNVIEPSAQGGAKVAAAVDRTVRATPRRSVPFGY